VIVLGTSGWQYRDWRGDFYPADLPQRRWLEHFASQFASVEVNNAFYRLPERDTFARWREQTAPDFVFAVKMSRYLTHIKRLRDPAEPVSRFLDRAQGLAGQLGPVLLQLPPTLRADPEVLDAALRCFPRGVRVAVELRHPTWWQPAIRAVLEQRNAALVWADRLGRAVTPLWRTSSWGYLRLHEGTAQPRPRYGPAALKSWLHRLAAQYELSGEDCYVYFNNDPGGAAVQDAAAFGRWALQAGLPVSRFPTPGPASAPEAFPRVATPGAPGK